MNDYTILNKPPFELIPYYVWLDIRKQDVTQAICNYTREGKQIPICWVEEYNKLIKELKR